MFTVLMAMSAGFERALRLHRASGTWLDLGDTLTNLGQAEAKIAGGADPASTMKAAAGAIEKQNAKLE